MNDKVDVEVCIASFNTTRATELTIRSALRRAGTPFRLIVGDGASTDGSLPMLQEFADADLLHLELAESPRKHKDWLDHWYQSSQSRYLVFSDSDVYYPRNDWLTDMIAFANETGAALVAGRIQPDWSQRPRYADGTERLLPGARPEPCLMLLDMEQVRGVVDTSFAYHEEPIPDRPGKKLIIDVAGNYMRDLEKAGLESVQMPAEFQSKYRHWGGLTWKKASSGGIAARLRFRQFVKSSLVSVLLAGERALDAITRR